MASNKRVRGIAVHRPLVIGSTATPLTPSEKLLADPNHTHKWTIAVRSAASNPLPTHALDERGLPKAQPANPAPSTHGAAAGTRGRDTETDYHRHVGGKDDISHFIRRVQFKLHESFPAPLRTIDKPPFQVTETGWGEFDVIIKIWWVAEASEKFLQTMHWLKLHPWPNMPLPTTPAPPLIEPSNGQVKESVANDIADSAMTDAAEEETKTASATTQASTEDAKAVEQPSEAASVTATTAAGASDLGSTAAPPQEPAVAAAVPPAPPMAPVVHSWQYDEVVFPDPTEAFYQTLLSHPPTPLPATAHQAFTDPKTGRLQTGFNTTAGYIEGSQIPPYPLYSPMSVPYVDGISQAAIQAEADRLDIARIEAVKELARERDRLIEAEKELRRVRKRADELTKANLVPRG